MARVEWVKQKLENWARWMNQRESGSLGFAKASPFARLGAPAGQREAVVPLDELDASLTHEAVRSLQLRQSHLYLTLQCVYVQNLGATRTAAKLQCARSTVASHLAQADAAIAAWFDHRAQLQRRQREGGFTA